MTDRELLARFLAIDTSRVPHNPESVDHPKNMMVDLARHSRRREIREDMVPRPGSARAVGPSYTARLIEFVTGTKASWRPEVAARHSQSVNRSLRCLRRIKRRTAWPSA